MEEKIKLALEEIKKDKDVLAVALFGSYARREKYRDIDLCIILNKKLSNKEMTNKLIKYSGRASDKLDISIFQQLPLYIRIRVLKDIKILYSINEDRLYEIAFDTIKEFDLYEKMYNLCLEGVKNG